MPTSGKLVLTFEVYKGDTFLRREEMSAESVTIGRGPAAMLRVDDDARRRWRWRRRTAS